MDQYFRVVNLLNKRSENMFWNVSRHIFKILFSEVPLVHLIMYSLILVLIGSQRTRIHRVNDKKISAYLYLMDETNLSTKLSGCTGLFDAGCKYFNISLLILRLVMPSSWVLPGSKIPDFDADLAHDYICHRGVQYFFKGTMGLNGLKGDSLSWQNAWDNLSWLWFIPLHLFLQLLDDGCSNLSGCLVRQPKISRNSEKTENF